MMDESKPRVAKRATRARDEMRAVARPTSSTVYRRAAMIQKKKPHPALMMLEKAMKKEVLYKLSLAIPAIILQLR